MKKHHRRGHLHICAPGDFSWVEYNIFVDVDADVHRFLSITGWGPDDDFEIDIELQTYCLIGPPSKWLIFGIPPEDKRFHNPR